MRRPSINENANKLTTDILKSYVLDRHNVDQHINIPLSNIIISTDVASDETRFKVILATMRKLVRLGVYVEWDDVNERLIASFFVGKVNLKEIQRRLN